MLGRNYAVILWIASFNLLLVNDIDRLSCVQASVCSWDEPWSYFENVFFHAPKPDLNLLLGVFISMSISEVGI